MKKPASDVQVTQVFDGTEFDFVDGYSIVEVDGVVKLHATPGEIDGIDSAASWLDFGHAPMTPEHARRLAEALTIAADEADSLPRAVESGD